MARRSGGTHKGVEEKRRTLPIYQHYTLSPGKTKSHHPEAKCNHCLKEFVCGSKQRLIRHIRKCNSISNPEQIIAETLNTLARNSATGQLNQSILEASNLLPSQISHIHHSTTQQLVGQAIHHSSTPSTTITTANSNIINNISQQINNNDSNHNTSGSSLNNDTGLVASSSNGSASLNDSIPVKRPQRRGRKPGNQSSAGPGIHVTTGLDGKTHFTPASQLPQVIPGTVTSTPLITQVHNGRGGGQMGYTNYQAAVATTAAASITAPGAHLNATNSGHLPCATPNHHHHHPTPFKLNSETIDKAYLRLVLTRNLPLSLCDTKEFQSWFKTFANDYKPPSSINLIAQNLKNEAQTAKQKVSNILVKAPKKTINLELHSWPDELRGHSWYAIIAGTDHRRFLVSVRDVLDQVNDGSNNNNSVSQSDDVASSDKILTEFIDDCIKRVGSDRINSLIFSGKNNDDSFITRARQSLYTNHPSIVTYYCRWHFTNLLCSDIIEHIENFQNVLRNSNLLMNFVNKRPQLSSTLEKFGPFAGASGSLSLKKEDPRWYSHLVCYLLEYIKNNNEAIIRALETYSPPSTHLSSDNNNNSSGGNNSQANVQHNSSTGTQQRQHQQTILYQEGVQLLEVKSTVMSAEYWTNLNSALVYLKPIRDIVALTSTVSNSQNNSSSNSLEYPAQKHQTSTISTVIANNLSLSDYMNWFLNYGKTLFENWRQSPDNYKSQLIANYFRRFNSSLADFKLLFAAYLLNPKHKCAYMTQKAKDLAIEEILNIASEFMPEESDGHTIFDQWKLYLVREQPYEVPFDESRTTPLEWWMSLPCAESIRRVALRILRLKAFTSPKPESLFSQLYFYEDETKSNLTKSAFEDIAILRYFYDSEDKIGQQTNSHSTLPNQNNATNHTLNSFSSNGYHDRTQIGQIHNNHLHQASDPAKFLPFGPLSTSESNGQLTESIIMNENNKANFADSYSDVESYINHHSHLDMDSQRGMSNTSNLSLEKLPGYEQFSAYVDFNETGIQVVEEPVEKKKRKWNAQEIISKYQSNHQNSNNNNNNDIDKRFKSN